MMSALKTGLHAALAPNQPHRRIWKHPELKSHSLLVLSLDRLHLAPLAGDPKPETVEAAEAGADLDDLLGSLATVVKLSAVRLLRLDLLSNSLVVRYFADKIGPSRLTVTFATPEAADACFTKIWRRLGDGFQLKPYKRDTWSAVRTPLTLLGLVLAVTAAVALMLGVSEEYAAAGSTGAVSVPAAGSLGTAVPLPKAAAESPLGWLDWRVVCGVGGAVAAGLQVWLYRRLTQPPAALEVARG
jgi:hypothetical protein